MAEASFRCKLITPEANALDAQATYAEVPMWDGQRGFMHNSSALVGKLGYGELRVELAGGGQQRWFIDSGFVQNVDDTLTILAAGAIEPEKLSAEEARAELAEANARKSTKPQEMQQITRDRQRAQAKIFMLNS